MLPKKLHNFALLFHQSVEKGGLLFMATILAIIIVNSDVAYYYQSIFHEVISLNFGQYSFGLTAHAWINEFLMTIFFFVVGMDIKRELVDGHLSRADQRVLPVVAAAGGVIVPLLVYYFFNKGDPENMKAWAVPAATDIAFALGVFALAGRGLPIALRVFLTALAIIDDLIAVLIIAIFYTDKIYMENILYMMICLAILFLLNNRKVDKVICYMCIGLVMWYFALYSGIHATISGVLLGLLIPLRRKDGSLLISDLEKMFHPIISYFILPLFAFANSGIQIGEFSFSVLTNTMVLGIAMGLFIGKQIGIFGTVYALVKTKIVALPLGSTLFQFYGISVICGIGFTMSLFIGILAFDSHLGNLLDMTKLGVLFGSLLSLIFGSIFLYIASLSNTCKNQDS